MTGYHNLNALDIRAMDIRTLVDDPEWQGVRLSLVGNWVRNHEINVLALRAYLARRGWSPAATRRVYNVLTGTVHRVGHTAGQASTDALRKEVRIHWYAQLNQSYDPADPRFALGVIGAKPDEGFPI